MSRRPRRQAHAPGARSEALDAPETHAVVQARTRMLTVADAYDEIGRQLGGGAGSGAAARVAPDSKPPLSLDLAGARMSIASWAAWCARAVMDARDEAGQPWTPRSTDAGMLLREVAEEHLGVFTADPLVAGEFFEACHEQATEAVRKAWPSGARWIRLGVPCPEMGVDDAGRRVPCGGEYRMWMRPDQDVLGDMVCDRDRTHAITPAEWQRAMRRRSVSDPGAAARLVRTMRLAGRAID